MTIYVALTRKLGRPPTAAELRAEMERIKADGLREAAERGALSWQRKRR